jgi:hypothetical protein
MAARVYATLGRAGDNDVVLEDPTVSNHHARVFWSGKTLMIEDLSSANGTFVDGERIKLARARPGVDLRCGQVAVPWSHEGLRKLLKAGAGARTLVMPDATAPTYVCGACGRVGTLPPGGTPKTLTCEGCGATLRTGTKPQAGGSSFPWLALPIFGAAAGLCFFLFAPHLNPVHLPLPTSAGDVKNAIADLRGDAHVGSATVQGITKALTPLDAVTRDAAIKIAARTDGPFHVEQVAEIWSAVREQWRYVNDPAGHEYFATATETIQNGYIGDCDDFATTLASMVIAIGGRARIIIMEGPQGGHAYTEACVQGEPAKVAAALSKHYRTRWKRYLTGRTVPTTIAYRPSQDCPIWLNLDWNSIVPGGAYEPEQWATAIYEDGTTETLTPANPAPTAAKRASAQ